jgi:hypothetical protein
MQAVHRAWIVPLPELECGAPAGIQAPEGGWPRIGHDRHAYLEVGAAGCGGRISLGERTLGRVTAGARIDLADELRLAEPPALRFDPGEAGYDEIRLRLVITPRVYFHTLRLDGGWVKLTARNTLDNTADLLFRIEVVNEGAGPPRVVERNDNLPPNLERDYKFELGAAPGPMDEVRVTLEKAAEALEGGYQFQDQVYRSK